MKATIHPDKLTAWYDFQAPFYSLWRDRSEHPAFAAVLATLGCAPGLSLLDAGCGSGLFSVFLASRRPAWTVCAVDASGGMVDVARRRAGSLGLASLAIEVGDLRRLRWADKTFDAIVLSGVFPNLSEPWKTSRELWRVLKVGGRMVVIEFARERMSILTQLLFHVMIWGYRAISAVFRQFRFAEGWSLEATTIPVDELCELLQSAGFQVEQTSHVSSYYIVSFIKGSGS